MQANAVPPTTENKEIQNILKFSKVYAIQYAEKEENTHRHSTNGIKQKINEP